MQYYYSNDGSNQQGPVTIDDLRRINLAPTTLVWRDGLPAWTAASQLPELAELFHGAQGTIAQVTPVAAAQPQYSQPTYQPQQAYQPQQGGYVPYQTPAPQQTTNGMAVTSMIMGILSPVLICVWGLGLVPAILAIIFGHMARGQIARGQGQGDGMALAGLILGYVTAGLVVGFIVFAVIIGVASSVR